MFQSAKNKRIESNDGHTSTEKLADRQTVERTNEFSENKVNIIKTLCRCELMLP